MAFLADTHVHVHPGADAARLLGHAHANLARLAAGPAELALVLAEREGHRFFRGLGGSVGDWSAAPGPGPLHRILTRGGDTLHLLAGRQVACRERIEVLALLCDEDIPDGIPAREALGRAWAAGALPVLPWSPGKWLGARGRLVRELLASGDAPAALGDIPMRPTPSPEPALMRDARRRGLAVLAGTDPLPLPGEEARAGTYASRHEGPVDLTGLAAFLRRSWLENGAAWRTVGRRLGWWRVFRTLRALSQPKARNA